MDFSIYLWAPSGRLFESEVRLPCNDSKDGKMSPVESLSGDSIDRFEECSAKNNTKAPDELRPESLDQRDNGWLAGESDFDADGDITDDVLTINNLARRFAVLPDNEFRARGDFNHERINEFPQIAAPISIPSWGPLAECARRVSSDKWNWFFAAADQQSSCKCEPIMPIHYKLRALDIWNPTENKIAAIIPITQLFRADRFCIELQYFIANYRYVGQQSVRLPSFGVFWRLWVIILSLALVRMR